MTGRPPIVSPAHNTKLISPPRQQRGDHNQKKPSQGHTLALTATMVTHPTKRLLQAPALIQTRQHAQRIAPSKTIRQNRRP